MDRNEIDTGCRKGLTLLACHRYQCTERVSLSDSVSSSMRVTIIVFESFLLKLSYSPPLEVAHSI